MGNLKTKSPKVPSRRMIFIRILYFFLQVYIYGRTSSVACILKAPPSMQLL